MHNPTLYFVTMLREALVAAGVANVSAGLSGGLGVAGSLSKTAASDRAGGRTQVAGLVTATVTLVALARRELGAAEGGRYVAAQLLGAVAANCTKNPDVQFGDLTALVAEKVKLK
mgnify:CR=1 FL=1